MLISKTIPKGVCGVYKIKCLANSKCYIGSAVNIWNRWIRHIWSLRIGKHHNPHLQNAFIKYGEINFSVEILEACDQPSLLVREKYWMAEFNSCNNESGFNLRLEPSSNLGMKSSEETKEKLSIARKNYLKNPDVMKRITNGFSRDFEVIDPSGVLIKGRNFKAFCRERKLVYQNMMLVKNGVRRSHRGWTFPNQRPIKSRAKSFKIVSPSGEIVEGVNKQKFCLLHGLNYGNFQRVLRGDGISCSGWKNVNTRLRSKEGYKTYMKPYKLRSPDGTIHEGVGQNGFAKKVGLFHQQVNALMTGVAKSTKGWVKC